MWTTTKMAAPMSAGSLVTSSWRAATEPAEPPMTMTSRPSIVASVQALIDLAFCRKPIIQLVPGDEPAPLSVEIGGFANHGFACG
jgi:hypothetical protein